MNKSIILDELEQTLKLSINELTIKEDTYMELRRFYVQEDLLEDMKVSDLPDAYYFFPYDFIDVSGKIKSHHIQMEIAKSSDNEAIVIILEQRGHKWWNPELGGILYPTLKRDLILKEELFQPAINMFDKIEDPRDIYMEYLITVKGENVKDVIQAAIEFDNSIEEKLRKVLNEVESICRNKLGLA